MNEVEVKSGDWVVVCDGRKALILENVGDQAFPILHTREVREHAGAHPGYAAFMDYGDADGYRKWLEQLQKSGSSGQ